MEKKTEEEEKKEKEIKKEEKEANVYSQLKNPTEDIYNPLVHTSSCKSKEGNFFTHLSKNTKVEKENCTLKFITQNIANIYKYLKLYYKVW